MLMPKGCKKKKGDVERNVGKDGKKGGEDGGGVLVFFSTKK